MIRSVVIDVGLAIGYIYNNILNNNLDILVFIIATSFYPYTHYNIYKIAFQKIQTVQKSMYLIALGLCE